MTDEQPTGDDMGLNDIVPEDAGDAKGGRPPEPTQESTEHVHGNPFAPGKDNEEYWQEVYDENVSGDEPTDEDMAQMTDYAAVRPHTIMEKMVEHGIYGFSQEDVRDDYPIYMRHGKWEGGPNTKEEKNTGRTDKKDSSSSGGLSSLIQDAKGDN